MSRNNYRFLRLLSVMFFFIVMSICTSQASQKFFIDSSKKNIDGVSMSVQPGDSLFIIAGPRVVLRFVNLKGSAEKPIVIVNCGGVVEIENESYGYGISINNCSFVHLTGTGDQNSKYGFKISKTRLGASGVSAGDMSTNYEIDHIEACNTGFAGITAKTNPTCSGVDNRGAFVQENTSIHDNYFHNTYGEGMYIGHSFYSGYSVLCDGEKISLLPHEIHGLRIYNNVIDSCGWDGIQVGCATENCEIYNNTVTNYGTGMVPAQHTGIQIGGGTSGLCYNNSIIKGSGPGIAVFGIGDNLIYNNIIVDAGYNYFPEDKTIQIYGIFCDDRTTVSNKFFHFINNTIINPKTDGIKFYPRLSSNNKIYNNIILKPGSLGEHYSESLSYVNVNVNAGVDIKNNFYMSDIPATLDFSLIQSIYDYTLTLDVKKKGINAFQLGVTHDFNNAIRSEVDSFDIGVFQFPETPFKVKKNYNQQKENLLDDGKEELYVNVDVRTLKGDLVYSKKIPFNGFNENLLKGVIPSGFYMIQIKTNTSSKVYKYYLH